jgi:hypothetical protein
MTAINKWYSYPRVTVIQINIHPAGENPICIGSQTIHLTWSM